MSGVGVEGGPHLADEDAREAVLAAFAPRFFGWIESIKRLNAFARMRTFSLAKLAHIPLGPGSVTSTD